MCSITFWPQPGGYLLGMNRDESLSRVSGLAPARFVVGARTVVHPYEPGGGTWISVNDRGVGMALVNWYSMARGARQPAASRGAVVLALRDCLDSGEAGTRLRHLPITRMNPFRAVGFFPAESLVQEWRWDLSDLVCFRHDWVPQQWLSSGYDEPVAQRIRGEIFASMRTEPDSGTARWLRRLHASHGPVRGPFSMCMHRVDAATVSYTEVEVSRDFRVMRHCHGALCSSRLSPGDWV